ncbi:2-oxoglutarate dehydrogenase E1 component [Myxococcota bacterium]
MSNETSSPSSWVAVGNADYIQDLYASWLKAPSTVDEQWQAFFAGFDLGLRDDGAGQGRSQSQVASLIFAYRSVGHLMATTDPLADGVVSHPALEMERFGLTAADLDEVFDTGHLHGPERATLRDIIAVLQETYCRSIGVEYTHIQDRAVRRWLQAQMEPVHNHPALSRDQKLEIIEHLIDAELFETFLQRRFPGQKRFSLEGAESLIPALHALVELAPELGVEDVVVGMAHRGRLNVLANILDKPYQVIFSEFEDISLPKWAGGDGDVKYHRGYGSTHVNVDGKALRITLAANPSHLEAVCPVVEGRCRAKQRRLGDTEQRRRVVPLLIHGDAAFAGQGLVAETLNLSQLEGYRTGGTVHFIINNQIGFTTLPTEARSSLYPTDVAKMVEAPVFHVNGEDPEAVVFATELALRFRHEFGRDIVVDMVCYRRHGHNEGDEPAFTQPVLYSKIKDRPTVRVQYKRKLVESGELEQAESDKLAAEFEHRLQEAFESVKTSCVLPSAENRTFGGAWKGLDNAYTHEAVATAVEHGRLIEVAGALTSVPDRFGLNRKVERHLPKRLEAVQQRKEVDWALAELLGFGTLLTEGMPVRLSGQDSTRGTFSHRHAVWHDTSTQEPYVPLNHIREGQAHFCAYNSMLSEAGVLGFDYGYSLEEPNMLVVWEAQFGDFANGAQVIIDQFVAASLAKWRYASGLVMLLPHGYEGQGPEHSNAYLERYLAACAEDNIQVCNLSSPAQYFHALRRQLKRGFRRPLIIMSPKSLLRHRLAVSPLGELTDGAFHEVLDDPTPPLPARRVVVCSGKVYYDLLERRAQQHIEGVALLRMEQLYPFHDSLLQSIVGRYQDARELFWVQEEPKNRGGWTFMFPRLLELFDDLDIRYVGRPASASPATGSYHAHRQEQEAIVDEALSHV